MPTPDFWFSLSAALTSTDGAGTDLQSVDASTLADRVAHEPFSGSQAALDPTRLLIITRLSTRRLPEIQHALGRIYPASHSLSILSPEGATTHQLNELGQIRFEGEVSLVVEPLDWLTASRSPATLFRIIAHLRSPNGCPWDREQTHSSLRDKVLEEAYEVADAIDSADPDDLRDELGDLLLLVALNTQIAEEAGDFTIEEVFATVNEKLVRRHPHVFGDVVAGNADDVLATWKQIKAEERGQSGSETPALRYDQLPRSMSVIGRIRRSEEASSTGRLADAADLGSRLLALVLESIDAGVDPEQALEAAYRASKLDSSGPVDTE